jgi:glycolate oxidase iron-sulfur subunit
MNYSSYVDLLNKPDNQILFEQCVHCGLCLQSCPTYVLFGTEMDSPRGRISLSRAIADGRIDFGKAINHHFLLCLACRSCESACPSGVQYGKLSEITRITIKELRRPGIFERLIRWFVLRQMMPNVNRLKVLARVARLYKRLGFSNLIRRLDVPKGRLKAMESLLPPLSSHYRDYRYPAPAFGIKRGAVAFFYGCIQEAFLSPVNEATIHVLQINGYEVHFPAHQTCCGAAHLHLGEVDLARQLARQNIDAFMTTDETIEPFIAIINNAGGCGACLREYDHLLRDDVLYGDKAKQFTSAVKDISEFLADHLNLSPTGKVNMKVTYSDSCHLRNAQKVINQPRDLLKMIPGVELIELNKPDICCGSAGVYNIIQTDVANSLLDMKMDDIAATGADTIVTTNVGCYLQLLSGVRRAQLDSKVFHLVELLDMSYRNSQLYQKGADHAVR